MLHASVADQTEINHFCQKQGCFFCPGVSSGYDMRLHLACLGLICRDEFRLEVFDIASINYRIVTSLIGPKIS